MAPWPSQQKEHAVPQLSCVMCRDRKLKCDKLDPCTNCKTSGAICSPIHRPRLPRGRHARRARPKTPPPSSSSQSNSPPPGSHKKSQQATRRRAQSGAAAGTACPTTTLDADVDADADDGTTAAAAATGVDGDLGTKIAALQSLVRQGAAGPTEIDAEIRSLKELISRVRTDRSSPSATQLFDAIGQEMSHFLRQLERLLQKAGGKDADTTSDCGAERPEPTLSCAEAQMAVQSTEHQDSQGQPHYRPLSPPPHLDAPTLPSPGSWSVGLSGDFWADLMDYQTHDHSYIPELHSYATGQEDSDTTLANSGVGCNGDRRALRLLGAGSFLNAPSPVSMPRDTVGSRKLCQVYLQNIDPIIKILHRPTLTRWMMYEGGPSAGPPAADKSVWALECAVCYAAATTMTEAQCQAEFQKPKADVSAMHRKMCEDAIETAGLVTTRDMTVLQAFVLYLVGRRSEDKGTAVWTLVALAVRLTSAMKLNNAPVGQAESFFQQQMRLRLWLTVCLMDLQASLAESSEPLISYRDAACAVPQVHNINDADFDVDTAHPVDSREELTDTTFALVTYRVQVIGRLLNFAASEGGVSGTASSSEGCAQMVPAPAKPFDPEGRRQLVRQFKQEVFGLLHYCDPESSPYAWFTWHSTHCIVASIRLSELLPFRCGPTGGQPSHPPVQMRTQDSSEVLYRALQILEKAQLIHSDPRSDGFRWYITAPRLALSTAIAECSKCTDAALVRWAWSSIEAFFRQCEASVALYKCPVSQVPLLSLMSEARERLAPLLQGGVSLNEMQAANASGLDTLMSLDADGRANNPIDPLLTVDMATESGAMFTLPSDAFGRHNGENPTPISIE